MSKNLTRKGLALGAVVALGSSLFAGTPATAAPTSLSLDTAFGTSGTTQNGILGDYFTLAASAISGTNGDNLKFYIEGAKAADLIAVSRSTAVLTADGDTTTTYTATTAGADAQENAVNKLTAVDNNAKTATVKGVEYVAGEYTQLALKLGTDVTETTTIKVTPFIENGVIDNKPAGGELTGTPVSITFHKPSTVVATGTLQSVTVGSSVGVDITLNNSINVEQLRDADNGAPADASKVQVKFIDNGTTDANFTNAAYNTTTKVFEAKMSGTAALGHIYGASVYVDGVKSSSAATGTTGSTEIESIDALSFDGANYRATDFTPAPGSTTDVLRAGAGSFNANTKVLTVTAGKVVGGQTVSFKISEKTADSLNSGATITAGGKSLTNSSATSIQSITVTAVSASDGSVTLPISYTGLKNNDEIRVYAFAVVKSTGNTTYKPDSTGTLLTGADSMASTLVNVAKSAHASSVVRVAKQGSLSLPFKLVDQFGQTPVGTFRVTVSNNASGNNSVAIASPVAVSAGSVTVTGSDTSTADLAAGYVVTVQAQKLGTDGSTYTDIGSTGSYTVSVGAVSTGSTITMGTLADSTPERAATTLVAGNTDLEQTTVDHGTLTVGTNGTQWAAGTLVTDSTGAAVPGASVTFTAAGVLFKAGNVYGLGSITVVADYQGLLPAVGIFSNNTGKQTIKVTSGSATKDVDVTWAAATTGGTSWAITAPTSILPGQTLKISAVLKDKYGVVVDTAALVNTTVKPVKVVYTGPGFVTSTIATETDSDGSVSFSVLLGALDSGTATVKFIYAGANDNIEETSANDDVVATASILIGTAPVTAATAAVAGSTGKFYVSVSNAAAKKVVIKVAGKFVKSFTGTAAKETVVTKSTKGSKKVTVFVGGKLVATKTVTVK